MSGFTKLHEEILDSSIWHEPHTIRILWITMLAMSDANGAIEASIPGLAARARITISETQEGLAVLSGTDSFSRSKDCEGRRIQEIDGGWLLVNHAKYREARDPVSRREYLRQKQAELRAKSATTVPKTVATVSTTVQLRSPGYVFFVATVDRVKIGFSTNPWARMPEIKRAHGDAVLLGVEKGTTDMEKQRCEQFSSLEISPGWFRRDAELIAFASSVSVTKWTASGPTTVMSTTSTHTEAEAEADTKDRLLRNLSARADGPSGLVAETGISEEELAAYTGETKPAEAPAAMLLESEDDAPDGKTFPWRQIASAMKRLTPTMKMPSVGDRRDHAMRKFWRDNGKTLGCFELLATNVAESDYVMSRNGHKTVSGRPYTWSWIFTKGPRGKLRAEEIMVGDFSNEKMAWVLEKNAKATMTKVMIASSVTPVEVNLAEVWQGELCTRSPARTGFGIRESRREHGNRLCFSHTLHRWRCD